MIHNERQRTAQQLRGGEPRGVTAAHSSAARQEAQNGTHVACRGFEPRKAGPSRYSFAQWPGPRFSCNTDRLGHTSFTRCACASSSRARRHNAGFSPDFLGVTGPGLQRLGHFLHHGAFIRSRQIHRIELQSSQDRADPLHRRTSFLSHGSYDRDTSERGLGRVPIQSGEIQNSTGAPQHECC